MGGPSMSRSLSVFALLLALGACSKKAAQSDAGAAPVAALPSAKVALPTPPSPTPIVTPLVVAPIAKGALLAKDAATLAAVRNAVSAELATPPTVASSKVVFGLSLPDVISIYEGEIQALVGKLGRLTAGATGGNENIGKLMAWLGRGALD